MLRILSKYKFRGFPLFRFSSSKPPQRPDKQSIQKLQKQFMDNLESTDGTEKAEKLNYTWLFGLAAVGIIAGYSVSRYFEKVDHHEQQLIKRTDSPTFGGNWQLRGLDGQVVTDKSLIGKNYIMYFGFTRCPDVCPAFLFKLTAAMKYISQHQSSKMFSLVPVFVSLDPEYDTPQRIQKFLANYHPSTIGLYTPESEKQNLENCMKQFNVYANKIPVGDSYSIDHSVIGYLMSEDGNFLCLLGPNLSSKQMGSKIEEQLTYIQTIKLKKLASYI